MGNGSRLVLFAQFRRLIGESIYVAPAVERYAPYGITSTFPGSADGVTAQVWREIGVVSSCGRIASFLPDAECLAPPWQRASAKRLGDGLPVAMVTFATWHRGGFRELSWTTLTIQEEQEKAIHSRPTEAEPREIAA